MVQGMHGTENKVFLSFPCILNARGLTRAISQKLKDDEAAQLKKSVETLRDIHKDLKACDFRLLELSTPQCD